MNLQVMFMCDTCGYNSQNQGLCPHCDWPLTMYTRDTQRELQVDLEEAMRTMSEYKWYV